MAFIIVTYAQYTIFSSNLRSVQNDDLNMYVHNQIKIPVLCQAKSLKPNLEPKLLKRVK